MPNVSIKKPHHTQEHDPNFGAEEFQVPNRAFLSAWIETDNIVATIEKR